MQCEQGGQDEEMRPSFSGCVPVVMREQPVEAGGSTRFPDEAGGLVEPPGNGTMPIGLLAVPCWGRTVPSGIAAWKWLRGWDLNPRPSGYEPEGHH